MSTDPRSFHGASYKVVSDQADSDARGVVPATLYNGLKPVSSGLSFDLEGRTLRTEPPDKSASSQAQQRSNPFVGVETYSCYSRIGPVVPDNRVEATSKLAEAISKAPRPELPADATPLPSMYVYFGQFLAHEVSRLNVVENNAPENLVSPSLDLDTFFWKDQSPPADIQTAFTTYGALHKGNIGVGLTSRTDVPEHHDLPRDQDGNPLIPDKRSDSNLSLAQLQTRMTLSYLKTIDGQGEDAAQAEFIENVQVVTLYDYLRRLINEETYNSVLIEGRKMVRPGKGDPGNWLIPMEFAAAAYRFGHAMVRDRYTWSFASTTDPQDLFYLLRRTHLIGALRKREPLENKVLSTHWKAHANDMIGDGAPNKGLSLSPNIAFELTKLDPRLVEGASSHVNLAERTLQLGRSLGLASAQTLWASFDSVLGGAHLSKHQLSQGQSTDVKNALEAGNAGQTLGDQTPLWFYVLREAQAMGNGVQLGPLGGRIVMETLHASICAQRQGLPPSDTGVRLSDLVC